MGGIDHEVVPMLGNRLTFAATQQTILVDFSNSTFENSAQVDTIYDEITSAIEATGK